VRFVEPEVFLISSPSIDDDAIESYLRSVDGHDWYKRMIDVHPQDGDMLVEFAGRLCYRSWKPSLNPNITKIREDMKDYARNVLSSGHGSVLEHSFYVFVFHNVSRVFTHELVRHRAGVSISQESLRFVRLDNLPFWMPDWAMGDGELMERSKILLHQMEEHQRWMAEHFGLDATKACPACQDYDFTEEAPCPLCQGRKTVSAVPFAEKKAKTSFMRRFAPLGLATGIVWGANIRTIRHVITMRTDPSAEEEIRAVFSRVAEIMAEEAPIFFRDFSKNDDGAWVPEFRKV
jgi:thymidylate synthase (FAD)